MSWLDDYEQEQYLIRWRKRQEKKQQEIALIRIEMYHAGILSRIGGFFRILAAKWRYR